MTDVKFRLETFAFLITLLVCTGHMMCNTGCSSHMFLTIVHVFSFIFLRAKIELDKS